MVVVITKVTQMLFKPPVLIPIGSIYVSVILSEIVPA
jgi:hypothetical protein